MEAPLLKMTILAFADPKFTQPAGMYVVQINPNTYTKKVQIEYDKQQPPGKSATELKYNKTGPEQQTFEFLFDSTGVLEPPLLSTQYVTKELGVELDLLAFQKVVLNYSGTTHEPRFLMLVWGTMLFRCRLSDLEITYKMFSPQGIPVRASAKATFEGTFDDLLLMALENATSPDLTHIRTVKAGDTLPGLCKEIYGDPGQYLMVAEFNGLNTVMQLKPGAQIQFPPLTTKTA